MITINSRVVEAVFTKTSEFGYVAEASDLKIDPGFIPSEIPVSRQVGNGEPLVLQVDKTTSQRWFYQQGLGCLTLTVFND